MQTLGGNGRKAGIGIAQNQKCIRLDLIHQLIGAVDDVTHSCTQVISYGIHIPDPDFYCVEHPDGIAPASKSAQTIVRYADTGAPAGIAFKGNQYRTVCFGFPLEALKEEKDLHSIIGACLMFIAE
jgi:hypothetical protein